MIVPILILVYVQHGFALLTERKISNTTESKPLVIQPRESLSEFHAALKQYQASIPRMQEIVCRKRPLQISLLPGEKITISSKNYPNNYPRKSVCKWKITTTQANYLGVYCSDFDLEPKNRRGRCFDYLKLNGDRFCGKDSPDYVSSTNILIAIFKSNKRRPFYRGFSCSVWSYESYTTSTTLPTSTPVSQLPICGVPNRRFRIVGGHETTVNEYPWQAALVYKNTDQIICGGSVITAQYILTAAHCTRAIKNIDYEVLLGGHCLSNPGSTEKRIAPLKYIEHHYYDEVTQENDIALIKLSELLQFGNIRPICLPPKDAGSFDDDLATVTGWGALGEGHNGPDCLHEVDVPVISTLECQFVWAGSVTSDMICAGYAEGQKDSCQGDSGGPLFFDSGCGYEQIGVVSFGYGCARPHIPGVYTRVTKYIDWITSNVGEYPTYSCRQ